MRLRTVWRDQLHYNNLIMQRINQFDSVIWTKEYLLGIVSEIDEVLREIDWKQHRKKDISITDRENLAIEFADLTKFIFSLWQCWDFDPDEMLDYVGMKSHMLEFLYHQEHHTFLPGSDILIVDLDGTIADYRAGFLDWLSRNQYIDTTLHWIDPRTSLLMDSDFDWETADYLEWKDEFERSGGYGYLPPFPDGVDFVQYAAGEGWKIVVVTARPINISRIWFDSMAWLDEMGITPIMFVMEDEQRITRAIQYKKAGHTVAVLEDNPKYVSRIARAGIECLVRTANYNKELSDMPYVTRSADFTTAV